MSYLSKEKTKEIRDALKLAFPFAKFSVRNAHYLSLEVRITEAPFDFNGETYYQGFLSDSFQRDDRITDDEKRFAREVRSVIEKVGEWYNNSDYMTDYYDVAFYYNVYIGSYEKPYKKVEFKPKGVYGVTVVKSNQGNEYTFNAQGPTLDSMNKRSYYYSYVLMKEGEYPVSSSTTLHAHSLFAPTCNISLSTLMKRLGGLPEHTKQKLSERGLL